MNPQAGLAFDTEGVDDQQLAVPPSPGVASAKRAAEAVEFYRMALARDVPFTQYRLEPITQGAIADLNRVSAFDGVMPVTAQNLFRTGIVLPIRWGVWAQHPSGVWCSPWGILQVGLLCFGASAVAVVVV